jgi:hypothetical protein
MKIVPSTDRPENSQKVPPDPRAVLRFTKVFVMTKAVKRKFKKSLIRYWKDSKIWNIP